MLSCLLLFPMFSPVVFHNDPAHPQAPSSTLHYVTPDPPQRGNTCASRTKWMCFLGPALKSGTMLGWVVGTFGRRVYINDWFGRRSLSPSSFLGSPVWQNALHVCRLHWAFADSLCEETGEVVEEVNFPVFQNRRCLQCYKPHFQRLNLVGLAFLNNTGCFSFLRSLKKKRLFKMKIPGIFQPSFAFYRRRSWTRRAAALKPLWPTHISQLVS